MGRFRNQTEDPNIMNKDEIEEGLVFKPKYDQNGLIPCITIDAKTKDVLMMAFMNEESLKKTIVTGEAHYWSRSRKCLWHKGATSGFTQKVAEMRTDCDQDCILISVNVSNNAEENEGTCHTGRKTCFYRNVEDYNTLLKNKEY